jgi:hypothetical protein
VLGIEPGEYARVEQVDVRENRITIERENGDHQSYDPHRLAGVAVYQEVERSFSEGDRVQFTAPSKDLHLSNRELGTIEKINDGGDVQIRMDSGREVAFNIREHPHLDHGYAVTRYSSQGQTARRVLIHVDTEKSELLVNNRFAYVSVSEPNMTPRFTRMIAATFPAASVAKDPNVRQQRWNSSQLYRRLNQLLREKCGPPKRSKAIA